MVRARSGSHLQLHALGAAARHTRRPLRLELADLPRCFLVRDGERMPVDFVRLFNDGDLTQNIIISGEVNPNLPGEYTIQYNFPNKSHIMLLYDIEIL